MLCESHTSRSFEAGEPLPFDVAGVRTISVDHRDLDSVEKCKKDMLGQIRAMEQAPGEVESPVTSAVEIQNLKRSSHPVEQNLAEIREILSQVAARADRTALMIDAVLELVRSQTYEISQDILGGGTAIVPTGSRGTWGFGKILPAVPIPFTLDLSKKSDIAAKAPAPKRATEKSSGQKDSNTISTDGQTDDNKD